MNNRAQGTIEYLVIISVIIVLSLIVVALFISVSNSPSQQIIDSSNKLGTSGSGISIVEAVTDLEGDSIVKLNNLSNDVINLTKISVGSTDNEYVAQLVGLDSKLFTLKSVSQDGCTCTSGQKTITCNLKIEYTVPPATNVYTLNKTITSQCVQNSTPADGVNAVDPIDNVPPVVLLNSPEGTLDSRSVEFSFTATESNEITFCAVNLSNGSSFPVGSVTSGAISTLDHSFDSDLSFDWNVSCEDDSGNVGVSSSKHIDILTDTSPPVISLTSPADNNIFSGRDLVFSFSSIDSSGIASCTLNIGSDSNTYYNLNNGENTIIYTKSGDDGEFDWSVSCTDGSFSSNSSSRKIIMDANSLQIASCIELQDMNKNLDGYYELVRDVNCYDETRLGGRLYNGGSGFLPIGSCGPSYECTNYYNYSYTFRGSLDGKGFDISSLYINRTSTTGVALFGATAPSVNISNLGLVDVNINGYFNTASLVGVQGYGAPYGSISNCYSSGTLRSRGSYLGGLIGEWYGNINDSNYSGTIVNTGSSNTFIGGLGGHIHGAVNNCHAVVSVTASLSDSSQVGGLFGRLSEGSIKNSHSEGTVTGYSFVGGLVGYTTSDVNNSYSSATVSGSGYFVGGLVGSSSSGTISYSYATGRATGSNYSTSLYGTGGLVGYLGSGSINSCYSSGDVFGTYSAGGLVGQASGSILYSYSLGDVNGSTNYVGGFVGYLNSGSVSNSYSLGDVNAPTSSYYGGFVGYSNGISSAYGTITKSFSTGKVTAVPTNTTIGSGFLGYRGTYGLTPTYSYWDINTSKRTSSSGGTGKTTLQMYNDGNYSTWDFVNIWKSTQNSHYPTLKWQPQ